MTTKTAMFAGAWRPAPTALYTGAPRVVFEKEDGTGSGVPPKQEDIKVETKDDNTELENQELDDETEDDLEAGGEDDDGQTDDIEKLRAANAKLLKDVMAKKAKLREAQAAAEKAARDLAAYDGVDPTKVRTLLKAERDAEQAALEAKGDFDRAKAMMAEEHSREKTALEAQIAELRSARDEDAKVIQNLTIGNEFATAAYIHEDLLLTPAKARKLFGAHFAIENGKVVGYDKPAGEAERTMLVDASGNALAFGEALKRIVDADPDRDTLLRVKMKPGGGSTTTTPRPKEEKDTGLYGVSRIIAGLNKAPK